MLILSGAILVLLLVVAAMQIVLLMRQKGDALKAPDKLSFTAQGPALVVHNPTPYYITISKLALGTDGKAIDGASGMVAPFGDLRLPLKGVAQPPAAGTPVGFTTIDDYGAADAHKGAVAQ